MPYIDPVTGAYVEDSLSALPPGYNQPKAGNDANVARMRAALNSGWDDNTPLPDISAGKSVSPFDIVKHAYQNMPGAGFVQGVSSIGSDMFGGLLGNIYGVGKQALQGELGNPQAGNRAFQEAQKLADFFHYTPPTKQGREFAQAVNKIGEVTGPLPELWNTRMRFTPDDLRVLGKTAVEDVRNFPMDYANTKMGLNREYPTMGSRAAEFTDLTADVARPLAEKAYEMYMNPESSVEVYGMRPGANLSGLFDAGTPMYAVKPKGGNWPTNLGSTKPLAEQGALGEHLSNVQYSDPIAVFEQQLKKHFTRNIDNRQLINDWEDFLYQYYKNHGDGISKYSDLNSADMQQLRLKAADAFAEAYNAGSIGAADIEPTDKKLHTASQIQQTLPHYNAWVMGPYQKYITNQMGTGLATDPLLQAVNEGGMPLEEIFGVRPVDKWVENRATDRRNDFQDRLFGYTDTPQKLAAIQNTNIGKTTATTPEGIKYEEALDASLYPKGPYSFRPEEGFPVSAKLDRNALISDFIVKPEEQTGFNEIRKKVFQDLLSGNLDPAKLSNVTPATVTRQMIKDKMAEFKEAQLSKQGAADWIPKRAVAMPTDMAFPDGSKMTIITPEMANADEAMTARDLGQITIDLNQCVGAGCHATQDYPGHGPYVVPHTGKPPRGKVEYDKYGYLRRLKNGEIEIASLKDPSGISQATIELKLNKPNPMSLSDEEFIIGNYLEDNNREYYREFFRNVSAFGKAAAIQNALQLYPELNKLIEVPVTKSIYQIKGHSNNQIKKEYVPQMVEWLNANVNTLEDVRDLDNLPGVHDVERTYDAIGRMVDAHPDWYSPTVEKFFDQAQDQNILPRFFTTDQFAQLAEQQGVDLTAEPPKTLSAFMKQTLSEEMYRVLTKNPESLYLQDNLQDNFVEDMDLLLGERNPESQIPLETHGKLVEMLLDHNGKYKDILDSALAQIAENGPGEWVKQFTEPQKQNILNIMASWFNKYPTIKLPTNTAFDKAIAAHPNPFDELEFFSQSWDNAPDNYWKHAEEDLNKNAQRAQEPRPTE